MQPETLQKKISESPLTKDKVGQKPSYCVVTNCTYDGVCYNAKEEPGSAGKNLQSSAL